MKQSNDPKVSSNNYMDYQTSELYELCKTLANSCKKFEQFDIGNSLGVNDINKGISPCLICNQGALHLLKHCPIRHANSLGKKNACFKCGEPGHHVHQCHN